ncbi:uncharacterized protein BP5553_03444 [Venustampulla echinocandica]|uniref:Uncharacterized protein n=1 Tax=Venustampulla echinocandica TaxID=2656787 RepID=A0A370TUA7_9HELO|nr:uncharacterized protein BP5553_03444 [Venustampulla echinocandica]RDL39104.1 hypothetical protein BP5553_03444 [Venustampulla echinocandica]
MTMPSPEMGEFKRKFNKLATKQLGIFAEKTRKKVAQELSHLEPPSYRAHLFDEALKYWMDSYAIEKRRMMRRGCGPSQDLDWINFLALASVPAKSTEMVPDVYANVSREESEGENKDPLGFTFFMVSILAGLGVLFLISISSHGWLWEI